MANFVNLMDIIYPVGSIYITTNATSPADFIGGTWSKIENCLLAANGITYGENSYAGNDKIAVVALPNHQHKVAAYNPSQQLWNAAGFWLTNAAGGANWPLLSQGPDTTSSNGWELWASDLWRVDENGRPVDSQQEHIQYHYSFYVWKRTA